ncbi:unnamed protein product [Periconia digitata]|uniref:DUF3176 domain containing protein n=1 Tax=Periconia digitata TaxID=1303443 RepID=A0A9W4U7V5_9PLEO|nr:unnamed protein product [Periconia digitata]
MAGSHHRPAHTRDAMRRSRGHRLRERRNISGTTSSYGESGSKSSLDITQKLEKKLAELNASENVFKRWIYEIVTLSIAATCMAAIVVILLDIHGKDLVGRSEGITAFTVLSKITSAALLLPTSEALGQLKWNWFHGNKSWEIWDFEIFDKASRGAWGSALLLFRTKGRSLAALGAILTLLLIANDTFFQQVLNLPQDWSLQSTGQISRTIHYVPPNIMIYKDNLDMAQQLSTTSQILTQYLLSNGTYPTAVDDGVRPDIPISCPTSNCTFPRYKTLGVCSQCKDVTPMLGFGCKTATADWISNKTREDDQKSEMCGYFFNITDENPMLMSGYLTANINSSGSHAEAGEALILRFLPMIATPDKVPLWDRSLSFKDIRNPITDVVVVGSVDGVSGTFQNKTPVATECMLSWCVKEIESSYAYGGYREKIVNTFTNSTPGPFPWTSEKVYGRVNGSMVTYNENVTITIPGDNQTFWLNSTTHEGVSTAFDDYFPSFLTVPKGSSDAILRQMTYTAGPPYTRRLPMSMWRPPNNITDHFGRIATEMTNAIRSTRPYDMVEGPAYSLTTFIQVKWEWLIFPFALLFLSIVFLVATIVKTERAKGDLGPGVWKTSTMPALIYSLPSDAQKQVKVPWSVDKASEDSRKLRVKLHPEKGWRISGQIYSPVSPVIVCHSNKPPPGWI